MTREDCQGWLAHCRDFANEQHIDFQYLRVLFAFGGPEASSSGASDFTQLETHSHATLSTLAERIVDTLDGEIDRPQAVMFARRFSSVIELLDKQVPNHSEARLLRVGIILRMAEVLRGPGPRALRVRAVADYFYSHCALLHHRPGPQSLPPSSFEALIDSVAWKSIASGIDHKRITGLTDHGPIHVNVLKTTGARFRAMDCREDGQETSLESVAIRECAPAAVSGGFFLYSEADIAPPSRRTDPVGLLIDHGRIINPPVLHRGALLQSRDGTTSLERIGPRGASLSWDSAPPITIEVHNTSAEPERISSFNRAWGQTAPSPSGWCMAIVGHTITAVSEDALPISLAGLVVHVPDGQPPTPGTTVTWQLPPLHDESPIESAMAGGPMLLLDGKLCINRESEDFMATAPPVTFSQDETFDQNLLPRMACGVDEAGDIFFAAIDGRNFYKAPGMTLEQTASWMRALGCTRALNLDGGSSKRMVIDRRVVDSPSTEVVAGKSDKKLIRPVHSAILIFPGEPS